MSRPLDLNMMVMYGCPPAPDDGPIPGLSPEWWTKPDTTPGPAVPSPQVTIPADHRARWMAEAESIERKIADVCADDRVSDAPWPLLRDAELHLRRLLILLRETSK